MPVPAQAAGSAEDSLVSAPSDAVVLGLSGVPLAVAVLKPPCVWSCSVPPTCSVFRCGSHRPAVMPHLPSHLLLMLGAASGYFTEERWSPESLLQAPPVMIALLACNSAHSLPAALCCNEKLRYPKDRLAVW